jgi:integrase
VAAFGCLRWGELAALRRCDVDLKACTIRVERQLTVTAGGGLLFGPPKSDAGRRIVPLPRVIVPDLTLHIGQYAQDGDGAADLHEP